MTVTDKELEQMIEKRMELIQGGLDNTKTLFITSGLFVAATISIPGLSDDIFFGLSGKKVILILAVASAIFHLLSYMVAEGQVKRFDKGAGGSDAVPRLDHILTLGNEKIQAKFLPWYYVKFHNWLTSATNNISTIFLLLAFVILLYCVIIS
jgi:hypothetical protein